METKFKLGRIQLYQNVGFLAVIALGFLDEVTSLSAWIFGTESDWHWQQATVGMVLVMGVWLLVSRATNRALARLDYLEKFMRVCAWCRHIDYKGDWLPLEDFLREGFDTPTTHGICPKCLAEQKAAILRAKFKAGPAVAPATPQG